MIRFAVTMILITVFLAVGCSKKDEDIAALEQEASQDEATAVLDSLQNKGVDTAAPVENKAETAGTKTQTASKSETHRPAQDYSDLDGYIVQIGSYSNYEFAEMMAEKYRTRDYPAFVKKVDIGGVTYYRLRIGVYETPAEARQVGELLVDRYSAEYWVDSNR